MVPARPPVLRQMVTRAATSTRATLRSIAAHLYGGSARDEPGAG